MNVLEFEVNNQILSRIDSQKIINKSENIYKCRFTFEEDSEWSDANKFVIFKDGWGNSSTVHLGKKGNVLSCLIPDKVLRGSYFQVSVYAGDLVTTNTVSIALIQSGYGHKFGHPPHYGHHHYWHYPYDNPKPHLHHPHHDGDIFTEIFDRLDNCIDSIVYDSNTLHLFSYDTLMESIYLPFIDEQEFENLVEDLVNTFVNNRLSPASSESDGFMSKEDKIKLDNIEDGANHIVVDTTLDVNSENAISNNAVTMALDGKEDSYNIVERMDELIVNLINTNGE